MMNKAHGGYYIGNGRYYIGSFEITKMRECTVIRYSRWNKIEHHLTSGTSTGMVGCAEGGYVSGGSVTFTEAPDKDSMIIFDYKCPKCGHEGGGSGGTSE